VLEGASWAGTGREREQVVNEHRIGAEQVLGAAYAVERRQGPRDRRGRLLWSVLYGGVRPRRRSGRRLEDQHRPLVDWHGPGLFASSTLVLLLCLADAFLTLQLIVRGAREANPVMALVVDGDARNFAIVKLLLTATGLLTLVALARFRVFRFLRVATLVHVVLAGYVLLVGYELLLLSGAS
jgi:hypothetical protein